MGFQTRKPRVNAPVTNPTLARYLDDLRFAQQAADLDRHFGRLPPPPGQFDGIDLPDDPLAAERAVNAAPRSWLEQGDLARSMEVEPQLPVADMLLDAERRRALLANRLGRMTPEQQARSLPAVGRQYEADLNAARANELQRGRDAAEAWSAVAAALGGGLAGALGVRVAMEDARNAMNEEVLAGVERAVDEIDLSEDAPLEPFVYDSENDIRQDTADQLQLLLGDDPQMTVLPDSPEDAVASAPGPSMPVQQVVDLEDLPGQQSRSIMALMRGGISEARAMDIILKGSSMSPDEYQMVTGGRR